MNLDQVRIVLVETSHPGNIGAAARAMKTMGLSDLWLVQPRFFPDDKATARASGADDLLRDARVVGSLPEAIEDCIAVCGTSARQRTLGWPVLDPHQSAERLIERASGGPVAVVFGREKSGLSNDELDHCEWLLHIPTNPDYRSLNLAMAVQVLAYEIRRAAFAATPELQASELAPAAEMERLYTHLEQVMLETGFLDPKNPRYLMRRLRLLINRSEPDQNEVNILRGFLASVQNPRRRNRDD